MTKVTWEEAVESLRRDATQMELVRACYYDDPLPDAARRFWESEEWAAVRSFLGMGQGRTALDLGAGRGIASYALAMDGWKVTALEPDPSPVVGAEAIRSLAAGTSQGIDVVETFGEELPFSDGAFDLVYGRAILHHAQNLQSLCKESSRVLKPRGLFVMTREHVITKESDLPTFLASHPLHHLYGGEHAYMLQQYIDAIEGAGLAMQHTLGPHSSVVNYFPARVSDHVARLRKIAERRLGMAGGFIALKVSPLRAYLEKVLNTRDHTPGRLYSFLAKKL